MNSKRIFSLLIAVILFTAPLSGFAAEQTGRVFSVSSVTPYDGAKNISPVNLKMDITFSEAVNPSTITMNNISVSGGAFSSVAVTGEKTATVYFNRSALILGSKYTVTLKSGIKALSGASLEEKKISFALTKNAPAYRQITNQGLDDKNFMSGFGGDTTRNISIVQQDGNSVLKFSTPGWNEAAVKQKAFVEAGKTYYGRARVKTEIAQKVWLAMNYYIEGSDNFYHGATRNVIQPGQWTTLEWSWTIDDNAILSDVMALIAVENPNTTVYIDDWHLFELGNDENPPEGGAAAIGGFSYLSETDSATEKMIAFGVFQGGAAATNLVSRIDAAKTLVRIAGLKNVPTQVEEISFADVSGEDKSTVAAACALGLMNGCSETEFEPGNTITVDQAIKTVVSLLGWSSVAEEEGGFPVGYRNVAARLGITNKIKSSYDAELSYGEFAQMLDNSLDAEVLEARAFDENGKIKYMQKGKSFLDTFFGYKQASGLIEGNSDTYLYMDSNLREDQVCIGGNIYECDADLSQYLGYDAEIWYDENPGTGEYRIVYICGLANRNKLVEFSTYDDYADYSGNTYTIWDENGNKKEYKLNRNKNVIYNGKYLGSYTDTAETFVPVYGEVKLVNSGNGFDTIVITDIRTIVVSAVDYDNEIIYDMSGGKPVKLADSDKLEIIDNEGMDYRVSDIKPKNVLSVIQSKDEKLTQIYFSEKTVIGPLCEMRSDDKAHTLVIGDDFYGANVRETYRTVNGCIDASTLSIGATGTYFVDYFGKIAGYIAGIVSDGVGYLVDAVLENNLISTCVHLKIFDISGKMIYLKTADKVTVDTVKAKDAETVYKRLMNGTDEVVSQLILYETNKAGEVDFIDTAFNKLPAAGDYRTVVPEGNDNPDGFRVTYSSILPPNSEESPVSITFSPYSRNFNNLVQLKVNPIMFIVPIDAKNGDEVKFQVTTNVWELGESSSWIESYQVDGESLMADYLVVLIDNDKYTTNHMSGYKYGIVQSKEWVLLEDEPVEQVTLTNGTKIYAENESFLNSVSYGDYIRWQQDRKGCLIGEAEIVLDVSEQTLNGSNPSGTFNSYVRSLYAGVYEKKNPALKLVPIGDSVSNTLNAEVVNASGAKIYVYNREKNILETGSMSDIMDYKSVGEDYSKVLVLSEKSVVQTILVVD